MKNVKLRATSAIILFMVILPFFFITYFLKVPGRSIGIVFYLVFSLWAGYEIIKHNQLERWANILLILLVLIIWIFPLDWYRTSATEPNGFWDNGKTGLKIDELLSELKKGAFFKRDSISNIGYLSPSITFILTTTIFLVNIKKYPDLKSFFKNYIISFFTLVFIPWFLKIMFIVNVANIYILFCIFIIPMMSDTAAYFGGRLLGRKIIKRSLAPHISPNKSWEGAIIGYLFGALFVFISMYLGKLTKDDRFLVLTNLRQLIAAIIILPLVSQIGDLVFSGVKRLLNIKDFSNLIPGHGGLMDRFDSISFVAVSVALIMLIK
ncbi:phosphatidate cytidylyltransferase [Mycoplasma phocoeninasale]|uniref:Phosphatidate cytidylyltransferase n=1 Tax=Mycoplasma phocoeninasale TaxID=2726117 RepID=A0A858TZZ3_9MOLU|nr:phosphatidate cytidylyltransferase [Mycoplasma phocoeninasale]QJG66374.1 phosphatidate cytidylyltransferase [Mycoplasma phocoeninasale]